MTEQYAAFRPKLHEPLIYAGNPITDRLFPGNSFVLVLLLSEKACLVQPRFQTVKGVHNYLAVNQRMFRRNIWGLIRAAAPIICFRLFFKPELTKFIFE